MRKLDELLRDLVEYENQILEQIDGATESVGRDSQLTAWADTMRLAHYTIKQFIDQLAKIDL